MSEKMTLTKADITAGISQMINVSRLDADRMVEFVIESIIKSLASGTEVKLSGFVSLKLYISSLDQVEIQELVCLWLLTKDL